MTAGGPEYGRLDRILATPQPNPLGTLRSGLRRPWQVGDRQVYTVGGVWDGAAEFERLRAAVAALEAECAALTDALAALAHDFEPTPRIERSPLAVCRWSGEIAGPCLRGADHRVHRTPAVVRAELEQS